MCEIPCSGMFSSFTPLLHREAPLQDALQNGGGSGMAECAETSIRITSRFCRADEARSAEA